MREFGLALSGGGSRAAAFHCGTIRALHELSLLDRVEVVSTVSGGSVFGGAWMAHIAAGSSTGEFVERMQRELQLGFIWRSVGVRLVGALIPGTEYSRTHLIADTFDRIFFDGMTLGELPSRPALCINTTILNNGHVAKFSRDGFSAWGLKVPDGHPSHVVPMLDFPVARAVAASAAFPIGLPPLAVPPALFPAGTDFGDELREAGKIFLTDGGVLENLGVQTLLKSHRFACRDMIVSDAGTRDQPWRNRGLVNSVKGLAVWMLGGRILDRLMLVMNDKQNRWARQVAYGEMIRSWLVEGVHDEGVRAGPGMPILLAAEPTHRRRHLLFVRVDQDWETFLRLIPAWRLAELASRARIDPIDFGGLRDPGAISSFLEEAGCDLRRAREQYELAGGDRGARETNEIQTGFTALSQRDTDRLAAHAAWQVFAGSSVYREHKVS